MKNFQAGSWGRLKFFEQGAIDRLIVFNQGATGKSCVFTSGNAICPGWFLREIDRKGDRD